jgi:FAD/FMN-containing dehydrogenase
MSKKSTNKTEIIPDAAYEAFKSIVGEQFVSTDPVHCQAYKARGYGREIDEYLGYCTRPACVILPETTEQVVKIIRTCNRYELPYIPVATMGITLTTPHFRDDFVVIDLKRMNYFYIDEKNMYAVVGPGVLYAQLLAECMKRDLYTLSAGGAQASVLANHLVAGTGPLTYRVGYSDRRINAAEWVTPEGDVVRLGSGVVDDWYWQDGLGPNLVGLIRGDAGWNGAMGVVTKLSVKVYPFQPEDLKREGRTPLTYTVLPPRMRFYNFRMPSLKAFDQAVEEIRNARIGAMVERVPLFWRTIAKTKNKKEFWEQWGGVTEADVDSTNILRVLLIGYASMEQLKYEENVLFDIMKELGGEQGRTKQTDQSTFMYADASSMWRMTGGYISSSFGIDGLRACTETGRRLGKRLLEYTPPLMPQHGDPGWHHSVDFGHQSYFEFLVYMDVNKIDPESLNYDKKDAERVYEWYVSQAPAVHIQTGFYCPYSRGFPFEIQAVPWGNFTLWMDRFKKEFDPKGLSNPGYPRDGNEGYKRHPQFVNRELKETIASCSKEPVSWDPDDYPGHDYLMVKHNGKKRQKRT